MVDACSEECRDPWRLIWTSPLKTLRSIADTDSSRGFLLIAILFGIAPQIFPANPWTFKFGVYFNLLADNPFTHTDSIESFVIMTAMSLVLLTIAGFVNGVLGFFLLAALLRWTGKLLGGKATSEQLRVVIAWASVPLIVMLVPAAISAGAFGEGIPLDPIGFFLTMLPIISLHSVYTGALVPQHVTGLVGTLRTFAGSVVLGVEELCGVWAYVILLIGVKEFQGFSGWRAIINIGIIFIGVPLLIVAFAFFFSPLIQRIVDQIMLTIFSALK